MRENRSLKRDLFALGLLALVVFLSLALVTYNPSDPIVELVAPLNRFYQPDILAYPQNETIENACGKWGALIAGMLLTALGVGAYYLVFSLGAIDALLLLRRSVDSPTVRAVGWCTSLIGLTAVAAMAVPRWSPGPVIGPGGYLGALGAGMLQLHFATAGACILATSLILGGLLLCTDYALLRISMRLAVLAGAGVTRGAELLPRSRPRGTNTSRTGSSDQRLAVRISGKGGQSDRERFEPSDDLTDVTAWHDEATAADEESVDRELVIRGQANGTPTEGADVTADATADPQVRRRKSKSERQQVMQRLDEASLHSEAQDYELPPLDLLIGPDDICFDAQETEVRRKAKILEKTFSDFGFRVRVVEIETGPVIAQFEVELEAGLRLSQDHRPGRRPGDRPARSERPDCRAHSRQKHRRHRSAQRRCARSSGSARSWKRPTARPRRCKSRSSWARTSPATRWSSTWPRCRTC